MEPRHKSTQLIDGEMKGIMDNDAIHQLDKFNSFPAIALSCIAQWLEHSVYNRGVASSSLTISILTVKFLYWYQEFFCPVEPLYFSDEKSTTVEK